MEIRIYIDPDGKVTITDLPAEFMPMVKELSNEYNHYHCHGNITGYAGDKLIP